MAGTVGGKCDFLRKCLMKPFVTRLYKSHLIMLGNSFFERSVTLHDH